VLPKFIFLSFSTIFKIRDCLKNKERAETWKGRERKENERKKLDISNGCMEYGSRSLRNSNKVWKAKSRPPLEFRWMIFPGPLSRSVDSSMSNHCSFTAPFTCIFSWRCFNRIRFLIFQFQSLIPPSESRFSLFNFNYRRNQCKGLTIYLNFF